jgi:hypothetical protein
MNKQFSHCGPSLKQLSCPMLALQPTHTQDRSMKFIDPRPFADPDAAARKLLELANAFEPVQDGRIYIEKINEPFLYQLKGTPAEYKAGLERATAKGWLWLHESGTYVKLTEVGAAMFA